MTQQQTAALSGPRQAEAVSPENTPGFFARGVNFYKLFWIFLGVSFLGCLVETAFMLLTRGELQNRSGVIYGSFSLVWGLGAVLFTVCFHRLARRSSLLILLAGTALGAAYEYACSWPPGGALRRLLLGLQPPALQHQRPGEPGFLPVLGGGGGAVGQVCLPGGVPLDREDPKRGRAAPSPWCWRR